MRNRILAILGVFALVAMVGFALTTANSASATNTGQVCDNLDTGHLSANDQTSKEIFAPADKVIVQVCVKAGSANQGDGPVYTDYNPGVTSVVISHPSGKQISHYSVKYGDKPITEEPCEPDYNGDEPGCGTPPTSEPPTPTEPPVPTDPPTLGPPPTVTPDPEPTTPPAPDSLPNTGA